MRVLRKTKPLEAQRSESHFHPLSLSAAATRRQSEKNRKVQNINQGPGTHVERPRRQERGRSFVLVLPSSLALAAHAAPGSPFIYAFSPEMPSHFS